MFSASLCDIVDFLNKMNIFHIRSYKFPPFLNIFAVIIFSCSTFINLSCNALWMELLSKDHTSLAEPEVMETSAAGMAGPRSLPAGFKPV